MKQFLILISVIMILLAVGCSSEGSAQQETKPANATPVIVQVVQPGDFKEYINVTGTVAANKRVQLLAEEGGTLQKIIRKKGSYVKNGDTLAIIENKILEAGFREARAALQQAELDYNSKKVIFQKRAISENEYLLSKYSYERALAAFELAKTRYSKLFITAPFAGLVNERYYDVGAYAQPMSPMFELIDNRKMKVIAGVAERYIQFIRPGTPAIITFDAFPGLTIEAQVTYTSRSLNPLNRTFKAEIEIPNDDRRLAPDMVANVKLLRQAYADKIIVPLDAVIETEQGRYVFVEEDGKAKKVNVDFLAVYQDSALVSGLNVRDHLVTIGQQNLTEGDSVYVPDEADLQP
ncbi:MAG: efflux RND transporter periplasmic adaptor subunit [Calditrichia bacterium]